MSQTQSQISGGVKYKLMEPPLYHVVFHNDDVTTMDFVVDVLVRIFRKTEEEAEELMMKVHTEGSAVAGTYYRDIAESKSKKTTMEARKNGFPLYLTVEEAK